MQIPYHTQKLTQTDYRIKYPNCHKYGCFVVTIRAVCETFLQRAMSAGSVNALWKRAVKEGAITKKGYVNDHMHVGNIVLDILGGWPRYQFIYVAKEYLRSNGDVRTVETYNKRYMENVNGIGLEWQTPGGVHINEATHDGDKVLWEPYPGANVGYPISRRLYAIVER